MYLLKAMHYFKNTVKSLIFELTFYEQMIINIKRCSWYNSTCFSKKKKKKKKKLSGSMLFDFKRPVLLYFQRNTFFPKIICNMRV